MTVCIVLCRLSSYYVVWCNFLLEKRCWHLHIWTPHLLSAVKTIINYKEMEALRMEQCNLCSRSPLCSNKFGITFSVYLGLGFIFYMYLCSKQVTESWAEKLLALTSHNNCWVAVLISCDDMKGKPNKHPEDMLALLVWRRDSKS